MTREENDNGNTKRVLVQLRTTEHDKRMLHTYAKESGMTLTDFVKARTLGKPPRIRKANFDREILIRLLAELGKVGSNINQIAKVMNTEKKTFYTVAVKETLIAQILTVVGTLSSEILKQLDHDREGQDTGERQPVGGLSSEKGR
jgi:glycine cleavage system pyridoxal-binding protein P